MKTFNIKKDIKTIRKLFNLSQTQFANEVGLSRSNIARYESEIIFPHSSALEKIYSFPFKNDFNLNKAKEMLFLDNAGDNMLLFHSAKYEIKETIDYQHLNGKKILAQAFIWARVSILQHLGFANIHPVLYMVSILKISKK